MVQINLGDKQLGALRDVLGCLACFVNVASMVPGAVAGVMALKKGADKLADIRQKNVAFCVASFGELEKMTQVRRRLMRKLTETYTHQLLALEDPKVAKQKQGALQQKVQKAKQGLLQTPFVGPAEQAAVFAMLWIIDQLHEAPDIKEAVERQGLDEVLFKLIIQKEPPEKLKTFWAKELIKKALGSGLLTKTGKAWEPEHFFTSPGICVMEGKTPQFYTHSGSNPKVYGWRLVSGGDLEQIPGLKLLAANKVSNLEPSPWFSDGSSRTNSSSGDYSNGKNSPPVSTNSSPSSSPEKPVPSITPLYTALCAQPSVLLDPMVARGELVDLAKVQQFKKK